MGESVWAVELLVAVVVGIKSTQFNLVKKQPILDYRA